jgi:hypothetical protein
MILQNILRHSIVAIPTVYQWNNHTFIGHFWTSRHWHISWFLFLSIPYSDQMIPVVGIPFVWEKDSRQQHSLVAAVKTHNKPPPFLTPSDHLSIITRRKSPVTNKLKVPDFVSYHTHSTKTNLSYGHSYHASTQKSLCPGSLNNSLHLIHPLPYINFNHLRLTWYFQIIFLIVQRV